jgi:hypothetical protein
MAQDQGQKLAENDATRKLCAVVMSEEKKGDVAQVKLCGRPLYNSSKGVDPVPVCLMHTRDPAKDMATFQQDIERVLKEAGIGTADFTRFFFPLADFNRRDLAAHCIFADATFAQGIDFGSTTFRRGANFTSAAFLNDASFFKATFNEAAEFDRSTFAMDANFRRATFKGPAAFNEATFVSSAHFVSAAFMNVAYFMKQKFTQPAIFRGANFARDAHFSDTHFMEESDFVNSNFDADASFDGAIFMKKADFSGSRFSVLVDFGHARFLGAAEFQETGFRRDAVRIPGAVFCSAEFEKPETVIFCKTYLGQALFNNCDISKVAFSMVEWREREGNGKRMVFEEDVDLSHAAAATIKYRDGASDCRDFLVINELYQRLTKNYDDRKDYWTAGDFHYGEMEMKRLAMPPRRQTQPGLIQKMPGNELWNVVKSWQHQNFSLLSWYKYASNYGESYVRPIGVLVIVLAVFTILFPWAGLEPQAPRPVGSSELSYKHFKDFIRAYPGRKWSAPAAFFGNSLMTVLSVAGFQKELKYEPTYPWGRALALLELLLTSTLIALFLLAVRRQFRR